MRNAKTAFTQYSHIQLLRYDNELLELKNRKKDQILTLKLPLYKSCPEKIHAAILDSIKDCDDGVVLLLTNTLETDYETLKLGKGRELTASKLFDILCCTGIFPKPTHGLYPPSLQ